MCLRVKAKEAHLVLVAGGGRLMTVLSSLHNLEAT